MDDFSELKQDVKEIKTDVKKISDVLLRNTVSLEIHEKRTAIAEKRIDTIELTARWFIAAVLSGAVTLIAKIVLR